MNIINIFPSLLAYQIDNASLITIIFLWSLVLIILVIFLFWFFEIEFMWKQKPKLAGSNARGSHTEIHSIAMSTWAAAAGENHCGGAENAAKAAANSRAFVLATWQFDCTYMLYVIVFASFSEFGKKD